MLDKDKTKEQLIEELEELRQRNSDLEMLGNGEDQKEEAFWESGEGLRLLLDSSHELITIADANANTIWANQAWLKLFGAIEERAGEPLELIHPGDRDKAVLAWESLMTEGREIRNIEYRYRMVDGSYRIFESSAFRVMLGGVERYCVIADDITERKRMEEELLKVEKLESIGVLAGGIAHDLNNLLTGVMGNISLARMYEDLSEKDRRLAEAEKASIRIKDLTQQLLTFSSGGMPMRQTMSMAELLKGSATFALSGSNIRCDLSMWDDLWQVDIDEGQINQVISNLIINAKQAMPGGGAIKIRAENANIGAESGLALAAGEYVKVSIEDKGIGIPAKHIQKIFDPFFTTKHEGNGLGLATSYSIIQKHDGHIFVESELGVGTTFHIYLPASPETPLMDAEKEAAEPIVGVGRILVMDDEKIVRKLAISMLASMGYEVTTAINGAQAIEIYKNSMESGIPYDVVILDLTVPGGTDGAETIKGLTKIDPEIKAIVSSGYSNNPIMANFREHGFRDFIAKPYKVRELGAVLRRVIAADAS